MNCLHCTAETTNGLALCELAQRRASDCLELLPTHFRNLARWRPGRAGSRQVPGSRVLYDGDAMRPNRTGDRISDALDETWTSLTTWARALVDDRGGFTRPLTHADAALTGDLPDEISDDKALVVAWLCAGLEHHLTSIATLEWCGEFVRELGRHESVLRGLSEIAVPGWYAGECRRCQTPTYVMPGMTWVTCSGCGATTFARDHVEIILREASDWVARPLRIAEAMVALLDSEESVPRLYGRIRKWAHDGDLKGFRHTTRDHDYDDALKRLVVVTVETGHARYRMGDVLDLVTRGSINAAKRARAV